MVPSELIKASLGSLRCILFFKTLCGRDDENSQEPAMPDRVCRLRHCPGVSLLVMTQIGLHPPQVRTAPYSKIRGVRRSHGCYRLPGCHFPHRAASRCALRSSHRDNPLQCSHEYPALGQRRAREAGCCPYLDAGARLACRRVERVEGSVAIEGVDSVSTDDRRSRNTTCAPAERQTRACYDPERSQVFIARHEESRADDCRNAVGVTDRFLEYLATDAAQCICS